MSARSSRRRLLTMAGGGALTALSDLTWMGRLAPVSAADARLDTNHLRPDSGIEPLVKLLETTPRNRLLEEVGTRIRKGLSYREVLAALLLAGVRNIQPRPTVGFKFHSVLVVNSAHLASLSSPDEDRWLPIFWALDYFKRTQADDARGEDWSLQPVDESSVPPPTRARQAFIDAMERWDVPAADAAVAGLARSAGAHEIFELFCRYGARDYRSIGHKAIFVANSWRTLQCIGWCYAEPILRSLAYALLCHTGEPNPAESDLEADQSWRFNQELVGRISADWRDGRNTGEATDELLGIMREGSSQDASEKAVELLNEGCGAAPIWDALFAGAGELLMRRPGIIALHAMTTTNALYYAWQATASDETRRLLMLQNAAFLPQFRETMRGRGDVGDLRIDQLEPEASDASATPAVDDLFAHLRSEPAQAARKTLAYLQASGDPQTMIDTARRLVFLKGNDPHDYKYSSAVLEDYAHTSAAWRNRFLAASMFKLCGADEPDNGLVDRIRDALRA